MNKIRLSIVSLLLFVLWPAMGQTVAPFKYFVQFTDKKNSPYSISHPEAFLSARALARRAAQNIPIEENDLPVNPRYIKAVEAKGVSVLEASKWLNGVVIYTADSSLVDSVEALPFVKRTIYFKSAPGQGKVFFKNEVVSRINPYPRLKDVAVSELKYGLALEQIKQIDGIPLQDAGYLGQNMIIAVLDGGFVNVGNQTVFDSLRDQHRILATKDFVHPGGNVYTESTHGRKVLSCMAADEPGLMIGTAPDASYLLLRSEDVTSENLIEEYNWVCAAEFADSAGAEIINSSLGYTTFDNPAVSHTYADMNGRTAISTIGAEIAASKGILVVNSAGNSGLDPVFPWIGAPADGDSVFTIGAVDAEGVRAVFSSIGPTYDGRIKPTVMAMGEGTTVADADSSVLYGDGTSFSSPIIAGMCACLWQAHPRASNVQIMEALKATASNDAHPNNYMGWGIPDFAKADSLLTVILPPPNGTSSEGHITIGPNPFHYFYNLQIKLADLTGELYLSIYNLNGQMIFQKTYPSGTTSIMLTNSALNALPSGLYFMKLRSSGHVFIKKLVKE